MALLNVHDYEEAAAEALDAGALAYYAGGANDELTLRENVAAFSRWQLRPRVLVDVAACTTRTSALGLDLSFPAIVAPMAFQRSAHPDGEAGMARAAAAAGVPLCLSTLSTTGAAEIAATGVQRLFQLYVFRDRGLTRAIVVEAAAHGFSALVLTVDTPVLGRRERDRRAGFKIAHDFPLASFGGGEVTPAEALRNISPSITWRDLDWLAGESGLPVVVKGVLTAEDAALVCDHGAAAIVVSNHGGRQLDGVPATIDVLPEVVEAVAGRLEVLVDGGVRRGTDIVRALALGARAVLVGRPALWGLAVGGEAGARAVLELLRDETLLALRLLGCNGPGEVRRDHVRRAP